MATTTDADGMVLAVRTQGRRGRQRRVSRPILVGSCLLVLVVTAIVLIPVFTGGRVEEISGVQLAPPSWHHPFGTDEYGRDIFARTFAGARVDLYVAAIAVLGPFLIGTAIGSLAAATSRRWIDSVIMRCVDAVIAFPFIVLVLAIVAIVGVNTSFLSFPRGVPSLLIAVVAVLWAPYAQLARNTGVVVMSRDYITVTRVLGYSPTRILFRHVVPNVVSTTGSYAISSVPLTIVLTAALPFLGAGVQPPAPELGNIMFEGQAVLINAWWISVFPGLLLMLISLGVTLIGDELLGVL